MNLCVNWPSPVKVLLMSVLARLVSLQIIALPYLVPSSSRGSATAHRQACLPPQAPMASCRAALAIVLVMHASLALADVRTADARACSLVRARSSASAEAAVCGRSAVLHEASALRLRGGATATSGWMQWAYKTLAKFGIFLKKGRLLVLGLDNAGKSTLLTVLLRDEVVPTAPTHQPVTDVIKIGHMKLRAVDMGGHEIARRMWAQYSHEADGIVYACTAHTHTAWMCGCAARMYEGVHNHTYTHMNIHGCTHARQVHCRRRRSRPLRRGCP